MRRYLIVMNAVWVGALVGIVGFGWLLDPYRIFHKPWFREDYYTTDNAMRESAAGIINTGDFDGVILGTSMAENFSPAEASRLFGGRFVNISMAGSSIVERAAVLKYALSKKPLSTVIFSADWEKFRSASVDDSPLAPYLYLYDDNRLNDLQIYARSLRPLRYAFCRTGAGNRSCRNRKADLETLVEWHSRPEHRRSFGGLQKWLEHLDDKQVRAALRQIADDIRAIRPDAAPAQKPAAGKKVATAARLAPQRKSLDDLLALVAQYPDTRFELMPFS